MSEKITRRGFIKSLSVVGAGSLIASSAIAAENPEKQSSDKVAQTSEKSPRPQVPLRVLGKTKLKIPELSLGIMYDAVENQSCLRYSLMCGANYWDTSHTYSGGNSELAIGQFLTKHPELRSKIIIASKPSCAKYDVAKLEEKLKT